MNHLQTIQQLPSAPSTPVTLGQPTFPPNWGQKDVIVGVDGLFCPIDLTKTNRNENNLAVRVLILTVVEYNSNSDQVHYRPACTEEQERPVRLADVIIRRGTRPALRTQLSPGSRPAVTHCAPPLSSSWFSTRRPDPGTQ
jgi:hypothetical protein